MNRAKSLPLIVNDCYMNICVWQTRNLQIVRSNGLPCKYSNASIQWFDVYREGYDCGYHRIGGPTHIQLGTRQDITTITREWCCDGELHRDDGPAVEWSDGRVEHWEHGRRKIKIFQRARKWIYDKSRKLTAFKVR